MSMILLHTHIAHYIFSKYINIFLYLMHIKKHPSILYVEQGYLSLIKLSDTWNTFDNMKEERPMGCL